MKKATIARTETTRSYGRRILSLKDRGFYGVVKVNPRVPGRVGAPELQRCRPDNALKS
jgi:hypothetical protein